MGEDEKLIERVERQVSELFGRVRDIEMHGSPLAQNCKEDIEKMETKIDKLTLSIYKAVAVAAGVIVAINMIVKFM